MEESRQRGGQEELCSQYYSLYVPGTPWTSGTSKLSREGHDLVLQFRIFHKLDTNYIERPLQGQRGNPDQKKWIEENSTWKDNQDRIGQDDDGQENKEYKKRKVDN